MKNQIEITGVKISTSYLEELIDFALEKLTPEYKSDRIVFKYYKESYETLTIYKHKLEVDIDLDITFMESEECSEGFIRAFDLVDIFNFTIDGGCFINVEYESIAAAENMIEKKIYKLIKQ